MQLVFPQLTTGAVVQYPIAKQRSGRTITNVSEDGRLITLADVYAKTVKWNLSFQGITDQEAANLTSFYEACEGPLQQFLFLDPTSNLLSYSEDFQQPAWVVSALVSVNPGVSDPFGTTRATRLVNTSSQNISLTQTVGIPGSVTCALSAYVRAADVNFTPTTAALSRTDGSSVTTTPLQTTQNWARFSLNSTFASSLSTTCDFSLTIPGGASLDLVGMQVDAQPNAGTYVTSTSEDGIFPNTRFDVNGLSVVAMDPDQNSVRISLISRANR